ncbi:MAG: UbiD family decarboxylase [Alphaproteobacteria bacterium]|nr:UbiD family decarboxylase [Alphaproteobacteria bacterium]
MPDQSRLNAPVAAPVTTLRGWLDNLAEHGRLAVIRPDVGLRFELAAISKRLDGSKATFFPHPGGHAIPVVSGLFGDRAWVADAMGVTADAVLARFSAAVANPLPWREVKSAPVQEIVHDQVDLLRLLPIPTHNELDSGPYISAGLLISRNPRTGVQNVAIHRCQVNAPDELGILLLPRHTLAFYEAAERDAEALEIAIVIGVDPLTSLASQSIAPLDFDELTIAGALHGEPIEVVKCQTNAVRVPASAEIVLEGRILPHRREPEGPFGEFPQYYGERAKRHVAKIDRITHRRDAIFHTIVGGANEHLLLGAIPREATLLGHLRRNFPNVLDVHLSMGGVGRYVLYVKLHKRQEGEAKNVIMGAFAGHYDIKHVIVVDQDVDIHNWREVEWAVATRAQADQDLVIVANAQGSKLDPSSHDGVSAKMGIDATVSLSAPAGKFKRIYVPGEESVDLAAVVDTKMGGDWRHARDGQGQRTK